MDHVKNSTQNESKPLNKLNQKELLSSLKTQSENHENVTEQKYKKYKIQKVNYEDQKKTDCIIKDIITVNELVVMGGKAGIGKTRAILGIFIDEWKKENSKIPKGKTFLHITGENPLEQIEIPFIHLHEARDFIIPVGPEIFNLKGKDYHEKLKHYLDIIAKLVFLNNASVVFLDPAPFMSTWNDESSALFIFHLQFLGRKMGFIPIINRNVGKSHKLLDDDHKEKGSSTTWTDIPRNKIFFKECIIGSSLQKECKNDQNALVLYHTKNSFGAKKGILFSKQIQNNEKGIEVCNFKYVRHLLSKEVEDIEKLANNSKEQLINQIKDFIKENGGKVKLKDMYEGVEGKKDTIRATAYKCAKKGILSKDDKTGYYSIPK